ncbi:MAG: family 16 glycosylhydrolase [Rikenellaceae bacterium]
MLKQLILSITTTLLVLGCQSLDQKPQGSNPMPLQNQPNNTKWRYETAISDEFDTDSLDRQKWHNHNPHWLGRKPSYFSPDNVILRDSMLILLGKREELDSLPEGYHTFTSAAVQSRDSVLYGFFEIRCKAMNSALSSAFWLYVQDSIKQEEIDIFEICGRNDSDSSYENTYFATSHYILKKEEAHISDHVAYRTPYRLADQFIVAGLEWNRDEIVWYIDGEVIRRRKNDFWHSPQTINFDSEAFPTWWGLPSDSDNGGEFQIEYFRYWSCEDHYEHIYRR